LQGVISSLVQAIELATGNSSQIDAVLQHIQVLQAELGTLFSSNGNGFLARNNGNFSLHTITGQAGNVTVLNGNGAGGDPLINLATVTQANTGTLRAITLDTFGRVVGNRDATITGTSARITVTNGNASAGVPTIDIASTYIGQTSITTLGTITTGVWNGTVITAPFGGTGQSSYVVGDLLYASATNALSRLAAVAAGNVLRSGGVGVAPAWGKVSLTTDISGTLPIANGGTGQTTASTAFDALSPTTTNGDIIYRNATTNTRLGVGATGQVLTVVAGVPAWTSPTTGAIVLFADIAPATAGLMAGTWWINTSNGKIYTLYIDVDTTQWVEFGEVPVTYNVPVDGGTFADTYVGSPYSFDGGSF
jgi:hypothetical protein